MVLYFWHGNAVAPVLAAAFPAVDVHVAECASGYVGVALAESFAKPVVELALCGTRRELVALEAFAVSARGILVAGAGVAYPHDAPRAQTQSCAGCEPHHLVGRYVGFGRSGTLRRRRNAPHATGFPFPVIDARVGNDFERLYLERLAPLGVVKVFAACLAAFGRPGETESACGDGGQGDRGRRVVVLPSVSGRHYLFEQQQTAVVGLGVHLHTQGLDGVVERRDFESADGHGPVVGQREAAGLAAFDASGRGVVLEAVAFAFYPWRVGHSAISAHQGHGVGGYVAVVTRLAFVSRWQHRLSVGRLALEREQCVGADHDLHGLCRRNPRPACQGKAVADVHADFQSEAVGFVQGKVDHLPPFGCELTERAAQFGGAVRAVDGHEVTAAQAFVTHGFEIGGDATAADGTVHPVPEGPGTGVFVGIGPVECFSVGGRGAAGAERENERKQQFGAVHSGESRLVCVILAKA